MENVTFVALLCCCLLITTGTDGQSVQPVKFGNCYGLYAFIDIRLYANNTIICNFVDQSHTIAWSIKRYNQPLTPVATCAPSSLCTVHQPDHFAAQRSPTQSQLFYQQYDLGLDAGTIVFCESQFAGSTAYFTSCNFNVIEPASLSSCTVEEDRDRGIVRGSCRFNGAFSYRQGFLCTWYQETGGQSKSFSGNIKYNGGSPGPSGVCTFIIIDQDWQPGTYTYSILFKPGPGKITVYIANKDVPIAGDVEIENCSGNVVNILVQDNNTIVCRGLNPQDTIRWTFSRNGLGIPVATCGPTNCTVHQLDHFAVERSPSHSTLFYQQYDRQVDKGATITCESHVGKSKRSRTCNLNVINGPDAGNVEIENCNDGFIDIREKANNTIKCKGFNERDIIAWSFKRDDDELPRTVATCGPSSNCTVHQLHHFAVERSPSHSTLFYQQHDREVDKDATVTCRSQFGTSQKLLACKVNVINPAKLSSCTVEEDRDRGTVTGRCRFQHVYSYRRSFHCTWYQAKVGQRPK